MRLSATMAPSRTGPYAITAAIPGGSRRAGDQREWLRCSLALIDGQDWYGPRKRAYSEICRKLARHMNWQDRTSRPGHAALGAASGRSADTVGRCIAWLRSSGLVGLVAAGWTPHLCAASLASGRSKEAAVYVLCVPKKHVPARRPAIAPSEFADLTRFSDQEVTALRTREAENPKPDFERPTAAPDFSGTHGRGHGRDRSKPWPLSRVPQNRNDGEFAARALQIRLPILGRISPAYLRSMTQRFFAADWSPLDVMHALDHDRRGRPYTYRDPVAHLAGWLKTRLAEHCDGDGNPIEPPSRAEADRHRRQLADQMSRRDAASAVDSAAAEAKSAGQPTIAERGMAAALAAMTPLGSAAERKIMTDRGPRADRARRLLDLGRSLSVITPMGNPPKTD